jgi:hypothetical protein
MVFSDRVHSSELPTQAAPLPDWLLISMPWLLFALFIVGAVGVAGIWMLVQRSREIERALARLDTLEEIRTALSKLITDREDLDLRRIEHALLEIRDGQKRVEDALLRAVQSGRPGGVAIPPSSSELAERVTNRLLAQGYERVVIVTAREELEAILAKGGEVLVEARRAGAACKGKVHVRGGALMDVEMQSAYAAFP